jgi:hypothetical protein
MLVNKNGMLENVIFEQMIFMDIESERGFCCRLKNKQFLINGELYLADFYLVDLAHPLQQNY